MGTWGTGIYSCDIAEDVKDICNEIFPFVSIEEGNRIIFEEFEEVLRAEQDDGEYASLWYALSDWQWKHGILTEDIRIKTLELLSRYAGLEQWREEGTAADVKKRIQVLDKLCAQLESPMPEKKLPTKRLAKPKHKAGDIIIFRACAHEHDPTDFYWTVSDLYDHYLFRDPVISGGQKITDPPFDAHDKYMAVLCVDTEKTAYSPYLPELFEENSVYAYYDYVSDEKPTLQMLQNCGFLPSVSRSLKDPNRHTHDYLGWIYKFSMYRGMLIDRSVMYDVEKLSSATEAERFSHLLHRKEYLHTVDRDYNDLNLVFSAFWDTKVRLKNLNKQVDNLLDANVYNPELLFPNEADIAYQRWIKSF